MAEEYTTQTEMPEKKQKKKRPKSFYICIVLAVICVGLFASNGSSSNVNQEQEAYIQSLESENEDLRDQVAQLSSEKSDIEGVRDELESKVYEFENGAKTQLGAIKAAYDEKDWEQVVSLSAKLHKEYNGSDEDKEAQELANKAQDELDKIEAQKESESKAAEESRAAEEAKGYETGITYEQLARTPDDFTGKKVKLYGKVIQVLEGDSEIDIRLAVDDDYDTILYGVYESKIVSSRVLENDYITIYGTSLGTISYETTMGSKVTIPGVWIEKIDQ